MLQDILQKYGEPWCYNHMYDFELECADKVADFYNNGGLEVHYEGGNWAFQYAALIGDDVKVGAWIWLDGEDFDEDAEFLVYDEDELTGIMLKKMFNKIVEIYGKEN